MKKLIIAASAAALIAGQVTAGGLDEPVVEAVEVVEDEKSNLGWIIPLVALGLVALAVSSSDSCPDEPFRGISEEEFIRCFGEIESVNSGNS